MIERVPRVTALITQGRLSEVPVDVELAHRHLSDAEDLLADVENLSRDKTRHDTAYEAAFHAVMAELAVAGLRLTTAAGHHAALAAFAAAVLDQPPDLATAARAFDRMRKTRARSWYDAQPVTRQQAAWAVGHAQQLVRHIRTRLATMHPDQD